MIKWLVVLLVVACLLLPGCADLGGSIDEGRRAASTWLDPESSSASSTDDGYDPSIIYPGQFPATYEDWTFELIGGRWKGSTLTVEVTITNNGRRRSTHPLGESLSLVAIDSTGKLVEPEGTSPAGVSPFDKEFYPKESWSGDLVFEMSPYSGRTKLYMTRFAGHARKYLLFDLGRPESKDGG